MEKKDLERKLIDLSIAFEAVFLEGTLELSYRLALRTATVLGKNTEEKRENFDFMQTTYEVRSRIVHGKTPRIKKKAVDSKTYVPTLEEYLRLSIVKYLRLIDSFKNLEEPLKSIDQQILK